ncbi:MAG: hypothetical protein LV479_02050 [Methylacidiphilales bacterium]|nr:hypothetical protein [Candidatus Methylacidiphilales bacterium]
MFAKFIKFLIALALIPLVSGEIWTLIDLSQAAIPAGQWRSAWFASLGAGFVTWLLVFFIMPRTLWLYVLGHEFTHALAAMLAGGKVSAFKVSAKGGHVMTDRVNWWITLSPYFVPIYALIWLGLWVTVDFYYPLKEWQPILYFGLGLFWAFHLTFTVSMFNLQQTDLFREGYIFSTIVILLINLLTMLLLLGLLTHDLPAAGKLFVHRVGQCYLFTGSELMRAATWARGELHQPPR